MPTKSTVADYSRPGGKGGRDHNRPGSSGSASAKKLSSSHAQSHGINKHNGLVVVDNIPSIAMMNQHHHHQQQRTEVNHQDAESSIESLWSHFRDLHAFRQREKLRRTIRVQADQEATAQMLKDVQFYFEVDSTDLYESFISNPDVFSSSSSSSFSSSSICNYHQQQQKKPHPDFAMFSLRYPNVPPDQMNLLLSHTVAGLKGLLKVLGDANVTGLRKRELQERLLDLMNRNVHNLQRTAKKAKKKQHTLNLPAIRESMENCSPETNDGDDDDPACRSSIQKKMFGVASTGAPTNITNTMMNVSSLSPSKQVFPTLKSPPKVSESLPGSGSGERENCPPPMEAMIRLEERAEKEEESSNHRSVHKMKEEDSMMENIEIIEIDHSIIEIIDDDEETHTSVMQGSLGDDIMIPVQVSSQGKNSGRMEKRSPTNRDVAASMDIESERKRSRSPVSVSAYAAVSSTASLLVDKVQASLEHLTFGSTTKTTTTTAAALQLSPVRKVAKIDKQLTPNSLAAQSTFSSARSKFEKQNKSSHPHLLPGPTAASNGTLTTTRCATSPHHQASGHTKSSIFHSSSKSSAMSTKKATHISKSQSTNLLPKPLLDHLPVGMSSALSKKKEMNERVRSKAATEKSCTFPARAPPPIQRPMSKVTQQSYLKPTISSTKPANSNVSQLPVAMSSLSAKKPRTVHQHVQSPLHSSAAVVSNHSSNSKAKKQLPSHHGVSSGALNTSTNTHHKGTATNISSNGNKLLKQSPSTIKLAKQSASTIVRPHNHNSKPMSSATMPPPSSSSKSKLLQQTSPPPHLKSKAQLMLMKLSPIIKKSLSPPIVSNKSSPPPLPLPQPNFMDQSLLDESTELSSCCNTTMSDDEMNTLDFLMSGEIPAWAMGTPLRDAIKQQQEAMMNGEFDPDMYFGGGTSCSCDLAAVFAVCTTPHGTRIHWTERDIEVRFVRRGSSGNWSRDQLTDQEKREYQRSLLLHN